MRIVAPDGKYIVDHFLLLASQFISTKVLHVSELLFYFLSFITMEIIMRHVSSFAKTVT